MKAIILAAGVGSRLRPITNQKPKTLVEVNGKPILGYILDSIEQNGITSVVICVGFMAEKVISFCKLNYPSLRFTFIENKEYDSTNNMYSLYLARTNLDSELLLMNGDLVYDPAIIKGLKKEKHSCVAVDKDRYLEESMKVVVDGEGLINSISKKITPHDAFGCSIDIYKIVKRDAKVIIGEMEKIIEVNKDSNQWTEVMLDNLFSSGKLKAYPYLIENKRWSEIDNFEDLAHAEKLFNAKLEDIKNKKIYFLDRDGTLTLGDKKLNFSDELIKTLKKRKKFFYLITNNSSRTPKQHYTRFKELRLKIKLQNILVSSQVAIAHLKDNGIKRIYLVANSKVTAFFKEEGFILDDKHPEATLLTYDDEVNYGKLVKLIELIRKGIPYYATHVDVVCPTPNGSIPDIGTLIEVIRMTANKIPDKIFGKPDKAFIEGILKAHKLSNKDAVIIGDRLYTDILLAKNANITSVLVLSGETKREEYELSDTRADIIINDLGELIEYI